MSQTATPQVSASFDTGFENQLGLTFTPDGLTAYWAAWNGDWGSGVSSQRIIYWSRQQNGSWSTPTPADFSGTYSDDDPFITPDGRWLYFVSERPTHDGDESPDANIWRYGLDERHHLEVVEVNSPATEYSPVVTTSGTLFFASDRQGGSGRGDLYRAAPAGSGFLTPQPLGPAFNTAVGEWNLWVSANESEIIFEASSRPTNVSASGDLYYSWRTPAGWTYATALTPLNSNGSDLMPRLHPDGDTLYYSSADMGGHTRTVTAEWSQLRSHMRAGYAPILLVANRSSHEVTWVDLARGEVVARVATGAGPHLLSNVDGGRVLATGFGEFPEPHLQPVSSRPPFVEVLNSRLTIMDAENRSAILDTSIENCDKPHASWIVDQRGFVTCESEQQVAVIDLESGRTTGYLDTQQKGSHVMSFEPQSRSLAVSNTESGSVSLINIDSGETKVLNLAAGSEGSLLIGGRFWIANAMAGSISIVDPVTSTVTAQTDSLCSFPIALSQDVQEQVWVACFASGEIIAIDPDNFAVVRRIELGYQPLNLLVHPTRQLAYASLPRQNAIAEIDLETGKVVRHIPVGIEPDGLRWIN